VRRVKCSGNTESKLRKVANNLSSEEKNSKSSRDYAATSHQMVQKKEEKGRKEGAKNKGNKVKSEKTVTEERKQDLPVRPGKKYDTVT